MLVHLKKQRWGPTVFLGVFFASLDIFLAIILDLIVFQLLIFLLGVLFQILSKNFIGNAFHFIFNAVFVIFSLCVLPFLLFRFNALCQQKLFKKHQVTPLFLIFFAVLGSWFVFAVAYWILFLVSGVSATL